MIGLERIVAEQRSKITDNRQRSERHFTGSAALAFVYRQKQPYHKTVTTLPHALAMTLIY